MKVRQHYLLFLILAASIACAAEDEAAALRRNLFFFPCLTYPQIAKAARVTGKVVVRITLKNGKVVDAQAESGHPMLKESALKHANQIRFLPGIDGSYALTYSFELADDRTKPERLEWLLPNVVLRLNPPEVETMDSNRRK